MVVLILPFSMEIASQTGGKLPFLFGSEASSSRSPSYGHFTGETVHECHNNVQAKYVRPPRCLRVFAMYINEAECQPVVSFRSL